MTISAILSLIIGILQFPAQMSAFLKILQKTPEEQHNALIASIQAQSAAYQASGRPNWDA